MPLCELRPTHEILCTFYQEISNHNSCFAGALPMQAGWSKPDADASRDVKHNWIQAKYVWRGFLKLPGVSHYMHTLVIRVM